MVNERETSVVSDSVRVLLVETDDSRVTDKEAVRTVDTEIVGVPDVVAVSTVDGVIVSASVLVNDALREVDFGGDCVLVTDADGMDECDFEFDVETEGLRDIDRVAVNESLPENDLGRVKLLDGDLDVDALLDADVVAVSQNVEEAVRDTVSLDVSDCDSDGVVRFETVTVLRPVRVPWDLVGDDETEREAVLRNVSCETDTLTVVVELSDLMLDSDRVDGDVSV